MINHCPDAGEELLLRGATIVSVDPSVGNLPSGDVLVRGDTIMAVGPDLGAQAGPDAVVVDARGTTAIPGFVDSHLHAWEGQLRGLGPVADFGRYLGLTAFGHGPHYRPQDSYVGTFATAIAALDAGITTIIDNSHNALTPDHSAAALEALLDAGIRGVHAVGSPFGADLDHVPHTATALRDKWAGPTIDVRLFEVHPTQKLWRLARDADLWVSTELGPHTPDLTVRFEMLWRAGLMSAQHTFNHCYDVPDQVWELIADSGAAVNLCPRSDATFGLGTTVPPVGPALRCAGRIGLSNDNEISYGVNMFAEMQTLLMRDRAEQFQTVATGRPRDHELQPSQVLEFATLGGAYNAGLGEVTGSLTPGKRADIVLVRTDGVAHRSAADPVTTVTTMAHPGMVDTVIVGGQIRKRDGHLVGIDADATSSLLSASRNHLFTAQSPVAAAS